MKIRNLHLPTRSLMRLPCAAASILLLAAASASASDYPTTILSDHPSAYYRFEEASGATVAVDSSVNMVNATYDYNSGGNDPALGQQPGIDTQSILFDGGGFSSDVGFVDIPAGALITPIAADGTNGAPFSAELWVQPTSQPSDWSVPIEVAAYPNGWNIYVSGATAGATSYFYLNMPNGVLFQSEPDFPISFLHWYHLVVTWDGANAMFYINSIPHGPYHVGYVPAIGSDAHIGKGSGVGWQAFIGGVDEVAFYTNVLSASQITNHYAVGTNSFSAPPVPPGILSNPASVTNYSGLPVSFTVGAKGSLPLHYIWLKNGSQTGPDAATYSFTAQYPADNGATLQVIITNAYSPPATSSVATLTVLTNLIIVSPPGSITRNVGSYAAFHVTANGAVPISYAWSFSTDGGATFNPIAGATNQTYWLSNVQLSQRDNLYSVLVRNPFVSSSVTATLDVQTRPYPVPPLTGYSAIVGADKPVAYWRLNELGGTLALDSVGTFDGTYTPGPGTIGYGIPKCGDIGVSLANGATVQIPWAPELNPDTAWSAETWFQPASLGANGGDYRVILSSEYNLYPNPYNGWYIYQQPNGTVAFVPQPGNGFIVAGPDDPTNANLLVPGNWYHLVVTDDLTNFNVYINGELRSGFPVSGIPFIPDGDGINGDGSAGITTGLGNTVIGQRTDGAFNTFEGVINDTAFYNYALTQQQVSTHYTNPAPILAITQDGTNVVLTWPSGTLQRSTNVGGPYVSVTGASCPYLEAVGASRAFYRVRLP